MQISVMTLVHNSVPTYHVIRDEVLKTHISPKNVHLLSNQPTCLESSFPHAQ